MRISLINSATDEGKKNTKPKTTWKDLEVISDTSCKLEKGGTLEIRIQKKYPETYSHSLSIVQKNIPQCAWSICVQALESSHSRYASHFPLFTTWLLFYNLSCVTRRVCTNYFLQDSNILHRIAPWTIQFPLLKEALDKETVPSTPSHQVKTLLTGLMQWKLLLLLS